MKSFAAVFVVFISLQALAQTDSLHSSVYVWNNLQVSQVSTGERRQILEGTTTHLEYLEIHATTIAPGKAPHAPHKHDEEEMIIVKEGTLKVTIKNSSKILGPGSVAVMMPGDLHGFLNTGNTNATYYVIKSKSKSGVDHDRALKSGGSFVINSDKLEYNEGPKGGRKQYFERPTAMMQRFEMHMTTLKEGLQSHDPHTHVAEEIMIVIRGNVDMQIGQEHYKAAPGDLVLLRSGILHAPKNDGKGECSYFAIQFQ